VFWRVPVVARELLETGQTCHVHAHFAVSQTEAALALAQLLDCGFSFTAHARDIYATPNALDQKLRAARFVVTCTEHNAVHLSRLCPGLPPGRLHVIRHGVPSPPGLRPPGARPRPSPSSPPLLLSAGRLIPKKGFEVLVDACALLRERGVSFECRIAGAGPLYRGLERRIARAGLRAHVRLLGWQDGAEMARLYGAACAFALASRVVNGGDRDGLPNVLVEALSLGLAVASTRVSAIPELVQDGVTGLLVEPDDPVSLAGALERLLADPELRERLGEAGRRLVAARFDLEANTRLLAGLFRPLLTADSSPPGREGGQGEPISG
jgi:glycosyltransferase involved in cell wall biosynthesis